MIEIRPVLGPQLPPERVRILQNPTFDEIRSSLSAIVAGEVTFSRDPKTLAAYRNHALALAELGLTPEDIVRLEANESPYYLKHNLFPYRVADAAHLVLFLGKGSTFEGAEDFMYNWGCKYMIDPEDMIVFQNPPPFRSIQSIPHFQILVRATALAIPKATQRIPQWAW